MGGVRKAENLRGMAADANYEATRRKYKRMLKNGKMTKDQYRFNIGIARARRLTSLKKSREYSKKQMDFYKRDKSGFKNEYKSKHDIVGETTRNLHNINPAYDHLSNIGRSTPQLLGGLAGSSINAAVNYNRAINDLINSNNAYMDLNKKKRK